MPRYIDADDLIHHDIEDIHGDVLDVIYADEIDNAPTADVAPVVRCKNCVLHENCSLEDMFALAMINAENAFCCVGERKDNDNG